MSFTAKVYKVMIASPGDVPQERALVREVIHEWNSIHAEDKTLVLMPIAWETDSSPAMGGRAQAIVNKQVLKDCDLLVAVFWTRLGSPTGSSPSGTVEEIEEHLAAGKHAMIYFSSAPVRLESVDNQQYQDLMAFKQTCKERGLIEEYEDISEFRRKFSRQLAQTVLREFCDETVAPSATKGFSPRTNEIDLSTSALELLLEAVKDRHGRILKLDSMGGTFISTNNRQFIEPGNVRLAAKWIAALDELASAYLIRDESFEGHVFSVTNAGYEMADLLSTA
jgi:hypothetical protein